MSDPEALRYEPLDSAIGDAARSACLEGVRRRCAERGVEVEGWAHLADLGISGPIEGVEGEERWVRYAAGDGTTWYIATRQVSKADIVATAADFGEMLANDVLPWSS